MWVLEYFYTKFQVPIISIIKDYITKAQLYSIWYNDQKPVTPTISSTKPDLNVAGLHDYATSSLSHESKISYYYC